MDQSEAAIARTDGGVAVGSYDDLQPEPEQPIDRNPSVACRICGESHGWMDYWKSRVTGRERDPRDVPVECDDCRAEIERIRRRLSKNASLDQWGVHDA